MSNTIELLHEIQRLMELKGENPFKIRAFEKAAQNLSGREDLTERAQHGTLTELPGIGKAIAEIVTEHVLQGSSKVRDELAQSLPPGLVELTQVPGLGPKKALLLIQELGIQSLGELEYACKENRLLNLRGFGPKMQQKILEGIAFQNQHQGFQRLSDAFPVAEEFLQFFQKESGGIRISETGALRRRLETLQELEFLIELRDGIDAKPIAEQILSHFSKTRFGLLPVRFYFSPQKSFGYELAKTTGTAEHWEALGNPGLFEATTEEEFFKWIGLPWIPPETRETGEEVSLARSGYLSHLLPWDGLRGVFHNHTTRSDGTDTLEEMVKAARKQGYDYIGISDHSQSAFYAQGLKTDLLLEQEKEVRLIQEKYPDIRIFWGIESDILADGSLDYESEVLKKFDFVIASVHSRFKMDKKDMTARILKAIRNPCTRFLGHPTGRLLLGRKGYDLDMEAVLDEAAQCGVAVELNSNPARLDIDWRWGPEMRKKNVFISVNPDAHETAGLQDTRYGIAMARKAMISTDRVVNSRSTREVEQWLKRS
jgi:DNA polymerase (family 10)